MSKTLTVARGFWAETLEALIAGRAAPDWEQAQRREAWRILADTPRPSRNDEAWRRTDLKLLDLDNSAAIVPPPPPSPKPLLHAPAAWKRTVQSPRIAGGMVNLDGGLVFRRLDEHLAARGVIFVEMGAAMRDYPQLVEPRLAHVVKPEAGYFAALHSAFWRTGMFLYVPRGVEIELPLVHYTWLYKAESALPHTLVVMEPGSRATLIEQFGSSAKASGPTGLALNVGAVELVLGDGAQLDYVNLQTWGRNVLNLTTERALLARDSTLRWVTAQMGSRLTKAFLDATLDGAGAKALLSGVYFADGVQHFDLDTEQNHLQPNTTSDLLYKGALKGQARTVWQGMIRVAPHAQRADGYQANRNLMLSSRARADSLPGLEILADDVRCTHGSTLGQLDPDEVFYLLARGVPPVEAEQLIVTGFFAAVLDRIPLTGVRRQLQAAIADKVYA